MAPVYASMSSKLQLSYRVPVQYRIGIHAKWEIQTLGLIPIILFIKRQVRGVQFKLDIFEPESFFRRIKTLLDLGKVQRSRNDPIP